MYTETSNTEYLDPEFSLPSIYIVANSESKKTAINKSLAKKEVRAFMVNEDGDVIIGDTEFHDDIARTHGRFPILEKGTIVPKSNRINFVYSDNFRSSILSTQVRHEVQNKIRHSINEFLGTNFN